MRDCEKYFELLNMLADGELPEAEAEEVRAHAAACPDCRAIYDGIMFISEAACEPEEAPEGLHEKIMSGVRRTARAKRNLRITKWAGGLAACLAVIVGAGMLLTPAKGSHAIAGAAAEAPAAPAAFAAPMAPTAAAEEADMEIACCAESVALAEDKSAEPDMGALYLTEPELIDLVDELLQGGGDMELVAVTEETEYSFVRENGELTCAANGNEIKIHTLDEFTAFMEGIK